jgi:hypothetical protein
MRAVWRWGHLALPRRWKSCGAWCGLILSRWRKVCLDRVIGRVRLNSSSKSANTFSIKKRQLNASFGDNKTMFSIPLGEKEAQIITFVVPINGRARVGLTTSISAYIDDRRIL